MIIANVDLQTPGSGIVLITGAHGFPECPQGLLGRQDNQWYLEDSYRNLGRDGVTERPVFFDLAWKRDAVLRKWFRHLGIDPAEVTIKTEKEF